MTAWQTIAATDVDADSPGSTTLADKYVKRDLHLREFLTGSTPRYNDRTPHTHAGVGGDTAIHSVSGPNLLNNSCPQSGTDDGHWYQSGVSSADSTWKALRFGSGIGDYLYQIVLRDKFTNVSGRDLWGQGSPLVLSFFALASGTDVAGELLIGIADGGSGYKTGQQFTLDHSQLSETVWRRFYCVADATSNSPPVGTNYPAKAHSTDVRLLFSIGTAFTNDFYIQGFSVCASEGQLIPFDWGPAEHSAEGYGRVHGRMTKTPVWSTSVAMTNAVEITARA